MKKPYWAYNHWLTKHFCSEILDGIFRCLLNFPRLFFSPYESPISAIDTSGGVAYWCAHNLLNGDDTVCCMEAEMQIGRELHAEIVAR